VANEVMHGPGLHEDEALNALGAGDTETAQIRATLAVAAAINRLAAAQEGNS
jgi:hypothetical protein